MKNLHCSTLEENPPGFRFISLETAGVWERLNLEHFFCRICCYLHKSITKFRSHMNYLREDCLFYHNVIKIIDKRQKKHLGKSLSLESLHPWLWFLKTWPSSSYWPYPAEETDREICGGFIPPQKNQFPENTFFCLEKINKGSWL